jgi:taurine--2-oxoglutarate transaminase
MSTEIEQFDSVQGKHLMHSWSIQDGYKPIPVSNVEGCWIHTTDGRKIFDLRSAHECINLGFKHPKVLEAMRKQMESVIYVTDDFATHPTAAHQNAAKIQNKSDSPHFYPNAYKIISRYRSYHGATSGAMSVSGDPRRWFQEPYVVPGMVFAPEAFCFRCPINHNYPECNLACADYVEHMIEMEGGGEKVAAVIVETVVGSNGIIPPPDEYLPRLREICDKWDVLLILDETMSGMGRTGKLFAFEHYDVAPDIIVLGKALGVYCPLSATIFNQKVAKTFENNIFGHGQSFAGHALACSAGLASLEVLLDDGLLNHSQQMGVYLEEKLLPLASRHPSIGDIRGLGMFWTIELVKDPESKEPLRQVNEKYAPTIVSEIARILLEKHDIYIPTEKYGIWIVPPLVVSQEEVDFIVDAIDQSLIIADEFIK